MSEEDFVPQQVGQPANLSITLFPHQLASIYRMEELECEKHVERAGNAIVETQIGINADPTGYGKTLSMVGLIARDKMEWGDYPYPQETVIEKAGGLIKVRVVQRHERLRATLIVSSSSIANQWKEECSHIIDAEVAIITNQRAIDTTDPDMYDIVIVIPSMFNKLVTKHLNCVWKRFIFDEPGHLRIRSMKNILAGFYWFVTDIPELIMARHFPCKKSFMKTIVGDEWCDFEHEFRDVIIRNDIEFVKLSFAEPVVQHRHHQCHQPAYDMVNDILPHRLSEMVSAGNIDGVIKELGGKTRDLAVLVRERKESELLDIHIEMKENDEIIDIELKRREDEIKRQLDDLENRVKDIMSDNCPICYSRLSKPVLEPRCQTVFCGKCLLTWLRDKPGCPMCRQKIVRKDLIKINVPDEADEAAEAAAAAVTENNPPSKENMLAEIITESKPGAQFVIFSNWDETLDQIREVLEDNKIVFSEIKGAYQAVQNTITAFREGKTKVLFLNSIRGDSGINLPEATDIIIYHNMSDITMTHIIGRTTSVQRKAPLTVHHLDVV